MITVLGMQNPAQFLKMSAHKNLPLQYFNDSCTLQYIDCRVQCANRARNHEATEAATTVHLSHSVASHKCNDWDKQKYNLRRIAGLKATLLTCRILMHMYRRQST